jgi:hypothetical protein
MIVYDPRGMSWPQYNKLLAEMFAPQALPVVEEKNWRDLANSLSSIGYFVQSGIPDPRGFGTWQDWAQQMCGIMSVTQQ